MAGAPLGSMYSGPATVLRSAGGLVVYLGISSFYPPPSFMNRGLSVPLRRYIGCQRYIAERGNASLRRDWWIRVEEICSQDRTIFLRKIEWRCILYGRDWGRGFSDSKHIFSRVHSTAYPIDLESDRGADQKPIKLSSLLQHCIAPHNTPCSS